MNEQEVKSALDQSAQCAGAVLDCAFATQVVEVPNTFQTWKYGDKTFCKYCYRCARKSQAFTPSEDQQRWAKPFDKEKAEQRKVERKIERERLYKLLSQIQQESFESKKQAENQEFWDRYEAHLRSDAWRKKREGVIHRCGNRCEGCANASVHHVHHLSYAHLGDELLFELVGLCVPCHRKIHPEL
jgi:hypothetical protein